jgi:membrane protein implicated in regulation of membrane protease activity
MKTVIKALNLALAVIVVGVMTVVWLGFNPSALSAPAYIERQQNFIRLLNVPMPVLGAFTILLTLVSAYLWRRDRTALISFSRSRFAADCLRGYHSILQPANQRRRDDVERAGPAG